MGLNINEVTAAFALCTCNGCCSRNCTVCQSPTWKGQRACVRALYINIFQSQAEVPASTVAYEEKIEQWVDWLDENVGLQPWQAEAFRAIMKHRAP